MCVEEEGGGGGRAVSTKLVSVGVAEVAEMCGLSGEERPRRTSEQDVTWVSKELGSTDSNRGMGSR